MDGEEKNTLVIDITDILTPLSSEPAKNSTAQGGTSVAGGGESLPAVPEIPPETAPIRLDEEEGNAPKSEIALQNGVSALNMQSLATPQNEIEKKNSFTKHEETNLTQSKDSANNSSILEGRNMDDKELSQGPDASIQPVGETESNDNFDETITDETDLDEETSSGEEDSDVADEDEEESDAEDEGEDSEDDDSDSEELGSDDDSGDSDTDEEEESNAEDEGEDSEDDDSDSNEDDDSDNDLDEGDEDSEEVDDSSESDEGEADSDEGEGSEEAEDLDDADENSDDADDSDSDDDSDTDDDEEESDSNDDVDEDDSNSNEDSDDDGDENSGDSDSDDGEDVSDSSDDAGDLVAEESGSEKLSETGGVESGENSEKSVDPNGVDPKFAEKVTQSVKADTEAPQAGVLENLEASDLASKTVNYQQPEGEPLPQRQPLPQDVGRRSMVAIEDMPVTLTFETGRHKISVGELEKLKEGYTFECGNPVEAPVTICANDLPIGIGELVDIDGRIGVRVIKFDNNK